MVSLIVLAALGAASAIGATAVANGDANTAMEAVKQVAPHGLHVALSHVPSWTHAHEVLTEHLSKYGESGGAGAGATTGVGAVVKKGLAHAGGAAK